MTLNGEAAPKSVDAYLLRRCLTIGYALTMLKPMSSAASRARRPKPVSLYRRRGSPGWFACGSAFAATSAVGRLTRRPYDTYWPPAAP
jgi:hypothetical protein